MEALELLNIIQQGESSKIQFKERMPNLESLAHELIAFSNTEGGKIIFGVNDKTGALNGLSFEEIQTINQQLTNTASQSVFPPVFLTTETINVNNHTLILVDIKEGISKPYKDRNGTILLKNGSDKRKVTSTDEIARLLQSSKVMYADELLVPGTSLSDINLDIFKDFVQKKYNKSLADLGIDLQKALESLNLLKEGNLTVAGLLLFSGNRQAFRPMFSIQCISLSTTTITGNGFADNEVPIEGTMKQVFEKTMAFIDRNIRKIQTGPSFNSTPAWEIPYAVFEELIVNALVHRDYFIQSTIKIFVFTDRIEIISPGKLPNSLTVENIKNGISIARNPILQSLAQFILPYKGLGTGVLRALSVYPSINFINEVSTQQFKAIISRR